MFVFLPQGGEGCVQGVEGQAEGVQQEGRQVLRQHVRQMEEDGERRREAERAAYGHRQHRVTGLPRPGTAGSGVCISVVPWFWLSCPLFCSLCLVCDRLRALIMYS